MRCEICGAELGNESVCASCDGGAFPATPPETKRETPWSCIVGSTIAGLTLVAIIYPLLLPCGCEHAPKTKSLNNIKQLAIAVQTYSQDYQETFPGWVRNPDGRYAHNVWDEQINSQVKAKDAFSGGSDSGVGIKSYSQKGKHDRVIGYALNGLLIAPRLSGFDGNADFTAVNAGNPPAPSSPGAIGNPSGTILFAELSTKAPMPVQYGRPPDPRPYTWKDGESTKAWQAALDGWIDISPRDFVEVFHGPQANPYREPYGRNAETGIARSLYGGGGGVYAFCDGHAQFMKVGVSVGLGTFVGSTAITEKNCWSPSNTNNMWVPR